MLPAHGILAFLKLQMFEIFYDLLRKNQFH